MKKLNEYFINKGTCAVISIDKELSKVIEFDDVFIVSKSATQIIDESCKYYGSSYKGRHEGAKEILKMNYKLPIMIDEYNDIIFFPTSSPRFEVCSWISLNNIRSYLKVGSGSHIVFSDKCSIDIDSSYYSLENQIFRSTMLESILRRRKNG